MDGAKQRRAGTGREADDGRRLGCVYDEAGALRRAGGDPELLRMLNEAFLEQLGPSLADVRGALDRSDAAALRAVAHRLRGSLTQTGLTAAARTATALEGLGGRGDLGGAPALVEELEAECERAAELLQGASGPQGRGSQDRGGGT